MHRSPAMPLCLLALLATAPAVANPALAERSKCTVCHAVDEKRIGPSFKAIAARYAGQPDVANALATKVIKGGKGAWGEVPMTANPTVSEADAKQLVQWILSLK